MSVMACWRARARPLGGGGGVLGAGVVAGDPDGDGEGQPVRIEAGLPGGLVLQAG